MFSRVKSLNKIASLQKRALCYLYSDSESSCDTLLAKSGKVTMTESRLRSLFFLNLQKYKLSKPIFYE